MRFEFGSDTGSFGEFETELEDIEVKKSRNSRGYGKTALAEVFAIPKRLERGFISDVWIIMFIA